MGLARAAILLAAVAMPASAQADTRVWSIGKFDALSVASSDEVEVVTGGNVWRVEAVGSAEAIARIRVEREDNTVLIASEGSSGWSWRSGGSDDVQIRVFVPMLKGCSVSGSSDVRINRVEGESFSGAISGSGDLRIADIDVNLLAASIAGSGEMSGRGRCNQLKVAVAGSGEARLEDVKCNAVKVSVMGSGAVSARTDGPAHVSALGSGAVRIYGRAQCKISKLGSAQVACN